MNGTEPIPDPLRIVFWGTPDFAVPSLRALLEEGFDVVAAVTQPDRPSGRGRRLSPSAVKEVALELAIPVLTPDRPRGEDFLTDLAAMEPDLSVVVAYGHILAPEVLDLPGFGSVNVHASLLPELRGAAPVQWAVARGYRETGVTVMRMVEAMDAGPILHQVEEAIGPEDTATDLWVRLSELGAAALVEALTLLSVGAVNETPQDHESATFAPKIDRSTARIDWNRTAREIAWHVRGMDMVPGAWTTLDGEPLKLFRPTPGDAVPGDTDLEPGTVVVAESGEGLVVRAGEGAVAFDEVQPPGKRRMDVRDWINGRGVTVGQRFA